MGKCETCGSQNSDLFEIVKDGVTRTFDSFECAIQSMATKCYNCGCLITRRPHFTGDKAYCCNACQKQYDAGFNQLSGRV